MRRLLPLAAVLLFAPRVDGATDPCGEACDLDVDCERKVTACLIESGRARDAVERLKPLAHARPGPAWARLLAWAYLASDNTFWAERTLLVSLEAHPDDCETLSWLAWVYLSNGDLPLAKETLETAGCPVTDTDQTRFRLIGLHISRAEGDVDASRAQLEALSGVKRAFPEDRSVIERYHRLENPGWIDPLSFRADILAGYTSNARAGSPVDPAADGAGSAIFKTDLTARFVAPVSRNVRPAVEGNLKGHGLTAAEARELSYLDLAIRPGIIFGDHQTRLLLAYKGNLLLINLDDKQRYYESHRGELEFETHYGLLVFAGTGRRLFREAGRTRTELDTGVGGTVLLNKYLQLLIALTLRHYFAEGDAYDQVGGTALLAGILSFRPGILLRLGVTPSTDYFPNSGGERGLLAFGTEEKRFDVLIKQFEEIWSPSLKGVRFGIRYAFSWRDSSADTPESNYDYMEHRILAGVRWSLHMNPFGPRKIRSKGHVPLPYGVDDSAGNPFDEERIQDLLRQDEAARAGSACVD